MKSGLVFALLVLGMVLPNLAFAEPGTASVEVDGTTYEVSYDATGLDVNEMQADTLTSSLTVLVSTTDVSSTLVITLERSFFDSKVDGADESFVVLADFDEAEFSEETTDIARTLTITVPSGTSSIDIIGTELGSQEETPQVPEEPAEEPPVEEPEAPAETPVEEPPAAEPEPPVETPTEEPQTPTETPAETEESAMQCGPGTVLKDGACVLDETCGPGTILKDGQCVLDEAPQETTTRSFATELVAPIVAAFVIAFVIMIILWAIGKAGGRKSS